MKMKINIVSNDKRYEILNELLIENGYDSRIVSFNDCNKADALVLPIKSTISNAEYEKLSLMTDDGTFIFSPKTDMVEQYFKGKIIDYSQNEDFLIENAYITSECALGIIISSLNKTVSQSKILVLGYGRIGKYLADMLFKLGADVCIYARRNKKKYEAIEKGLSIKELSCVGEEHFDIIVNTVPERIIPKQQSDKISKKTVVIDLASLPGGFEDENAARKALALPGKMKSESAARAIYDLIDRYLSSERI